MKNTYLTELPTHQGTKSPSRRKRRESFFLANNKNFELMRKSMMNFMMTEKTPYGNLPRIEEYFINSNRKVHFKFNENNFAILNKKKKLLEAEILLEKVRF